MKNILIICEKFAPENTVGATRMTKIAKYLKLSGKYEVTVVTRKYSGVADSLLQKDIQYIDKFIYASEGWFGRKVKNAYTYKSTSKGYADEKRKQASILAQKDIKAYFIALKKSIVSVISVLITEIIARSYAKNATNEIRKQNCKYDVIISSHGPEASHYIGRSCKKIQNDAIWIADFRDQLYQGEATFGLLRLWSKTYAQRICQKADWYTAVSKGCMENIFPPIGSNVKVITNGYDKDDVIGIEGKYKNYGVLTFAYIGSFLIGRRDISPVFRAVQELVLEKKIDKKKIQFIYAGDDEAEFILQSHKYELDSSIFSLGKVRREEALSWEMSSDILLLAAWNTQGYTGSLPAKFYEYLNCGKNIVCCISGTAGESELKSIIESTNAGFCYEEFSDEKDGVALKEYIMNAYNIFFSTGKFDNKYNVDAVKKYDHKILSLQIQDLIEKSG